MAQITGNGFAYHVWRTRGDRALQQYVVGCDDAVQEQYFRDVWAQLQEGAVLPVDKTTKQLIMAMQKVKSSNISELGYDPDSGELRVRFASGGLFSYANVPQTEFEALRGAKSVGSYFARAIRPKFKATAL